MSTPFEQHDGDELLLDQIQRAAFDYFAVNTNRDNGLIADTSRADSPCSIAVVGFALSAYIVGVERGWMTRADAARRTLAALHFFYASDQSGSAQATGFKGFYYHFLDMRRGTRVWASELSMIDTALLIAGVLNAAVYFDAAASDERDIRELADALYRRVDWSWSRNGGDCVLHGWKPECGFLHYGWEGYSEGIILYTLGSGSPTHPLPESSFEAWTLTYQWEHLYGTDVLYAGPLFIHLYSHAWIDFRGIRDRFMREKRCDYFENTRRAICIQTEYAQRNPNGFVGYGDNAWGLTACEGPYARVMKIAGQQHGSFGYAARGAPHGPDDGTLAGWAAAASLPFAPETALAAVRSLWAADPAHDHLLASGFNPTLRGADHNDWISPGRFGLDQGIVLLMIENHRSGLIWRLMRDCPPLRVGLRRAGFRGGWL